MAKRILCIEDDYGMRDSIRLILEMAGFEMDEAHDGRSGVDLALKTLPDLIVCDIRMPGMDGFETLEELHRHESTAHIPFVFLTGEDPRTHLRKGMNLGANDFILKPIDMDDFIKAVQVRLDEADQRKKESQRVIAELSERITRALPHELRTPMTGILGLAEFLKLQAEELKPGEIKELSQSLFDSAVRMNQTLEKFWIYTQSLILASDQPNLSSSRTVGTQQAHEAVAEKAKEIASSYNRSADLVLNLSPLSAAVARQYLDQLVWQVIDNAFKFSPAGSEVIISTSCDVEIGTIIIRDYGRGMSEDHIGKIHTFMQFDREKHEQQGLGLGLMIAKCLTEIHGGTFEITSVPGSGTTVTLSFPLLQVI